MSLVLWDIPIHFKVKAFKGVSLHNPKLCLSFYLLTNISDRFFNWAPHFISIQIFQNFWYEIHSSSLELGRKRVELNVCESFKYFSRELLRKYLKKNICHFQRPISSWRGPQWKSLFWAFFLNSLRNPTTQKISWIWWRSSLFYSSTALSLSR